MNSRDSTPQSQIEHAAGAWHRSAVTVWVIRAASLVLLLGLWEWYSAGVSRALLAPPSAVAAAFGQQLFVDGKLPRAFVVSAQSLIAGFALSASVGICLGVLMGRNQTLERLLDPYVSFLYALPTVALIPVLIVWVGIDVQLRVSIVFLSGVFIVIVNTMVGVKNVDDELIDLGRVNCASEPQLLRTIVLPFALPYIFAGLRVAFAQCLIGVIVAEMTTTLAGLGGLIIVAANRFRTAETLVPIFAIMLTAIVLTSQMRRLQGALTPWQEAQRDL